MAQTYAQRSEQTYDDYISAYITNDSNEEFEVCFGLYHGSGRWVFWSDTGYEWTIDEEVELVFQEAINDQGDTVSLPKELIQKAADIAYDLYWERYAEGDYK